MRLFFSFQLQESQEEQTSKKDVKQTDEDDEVTYADLDKSALGGGKKDLIKLYFSFFPFSNYHLFFHLNFCNTF